MNKFIAKTVAKIGLLIPLTMTSTVVLAASVSSSKFDQEQIEQFRSQINSMKERNRGPFQRLRWFCNDGSVHPPKPYPCKERGGGRQHGQFSESTKQLRENGFYIANVLAATDAEEIASDLSPLSPLSAILLEQYLIEVDDGWILRKARFYRGAFQVESEQKVAKRIMRKLLENDEAVNNHFLLLLEAYNRLPGVNSDSNLLDKVRSDSIGIQQKLPEFAPLRNKIHGRLEASDENAVREFADKHTDHPDHAAIIELADNIAALYDNSTLLWPVSDGEAQSVNEELEILRAELQEAKWLPENSKDWWDANSASSQFMHLASISAALRNYLTTNADDRRRLFKMVPKLAQNQFILGRSLVQNADAIASRHQALELIQASSASLYGLGFLSKVEQTQLQDLVSQALANEQLSVSEYRALLQELAKAPVWAGQRAQFYFQAQVNNFSLLEPAAHEYIPNLMRGSSLLIYGELLKQLNTDLANLSGIQHRFFESDKSGGLRVLNAGAARGYLHTPESLAKLKNPPKDVILKVPETLADLPSVTGILTAFEGNQLSHVQLLARNLGIPNIVVADELLGTIDEHIGDWVEVLASEGGVVSITQQPAPQEPVEGDVDEPDNVLIKVDLDKLDLSAQQAISINDLDASSSGVTVGPKAAKVAQLSKQFPGKVSPALALPFGSFRAMLDNNQHSSGVPMFEWIKQQYEQLDQLKGVERAQFRDGFLLELRTWFENVELDPEFVADLKQKLDNEFGKDGSYGVFIRSDTNVEDLPGFTGAGLNLTLPNVVGFDNIIAGMRRVWASPFTERAFGWRQARMDKPEHVYTAILLHKSVDSDVSGVLVTKDIFSQQPNQLSVVVNEGVAGGVDGLAAESLRIDRDTAEVLRFASATAPYKRILIEKGGSKLVPASGAEQLLSEEHIEQIIQFSNDVGGWFSSEEDAIADVEFGFHDDQFVLFQIRPLVDSEVGQENSELIKLDTLLNKNNNKVISLSDSLSNANQ